MPRHVNCHDTAPTSTQLPLGQPSDRVRLPGAFLTIWLGVLHRCRFTQRAPPPRQPPGHVMARRLSGVISAAGLPLRRRGGL